MSFMSSAGSSVVFKSPEAEPGNLPRASAPSSTLDPPLLQIIDEDWLDIVLNPVTGEATMEGVSKRQAQKRMQNYGQDIVRLACMKLLMDKYPTDSGAALQAKRESFCRREQIATFAQIYRLTTNITDINLPPSEFHKTIAAIFEAYVGVASLEHPLDRVHEWVYRICRSYGDESPALGIPSTLSSPKSGAVIVPNTHTLLPSPLSQMNNAPKGHHPYASNPQQLPYEPTNPYMAPQPNFPPQQPVQPTNRSSGTLAIFRQKASQMRKQVSFTEYPSGPDHQKVWTCGILMDNVLIGEGTATTKQAAKDIAAQHAMMTVGWM